MDDHTLAASLHVNFQFKITQAVPLHGLITFPELAGAVSLQGLDIAWFI